MKGVVKGFSSFFSAFGFIFSNGLAMWYLAPVLMWLLLVIVLSFSLAAWLTPIITQWLSQWWGTPIPADTGFWSKMGQLASAGLSIALSIAIKFLIGYILGRVMKYIILIIMSPLLAFLSEKAEEIRTGKTYPFQFIQFLKDILRSITISLRNLFLELILMGAGFLLSVSFPVLTPLVTAVLYAVNCYFMGFNLFDYISERRKMGIRSSVRYMRQNAGMVFGLGLAFNLVSLIPFADWVIAPVNGAIGAVLAEPSAGNRQE